MELVMNKQELIDLGKQMKGLRIVCRDGKCWITQAGDFRDRILRTGESFLVETAGQLIITAMEPSRLALVQSTHGKPSLLNKLIDELTKDTLMANR